MKIKKILNQINQLTEYTIKNGFSVDFNDARIIDGSKIQWDNYQNIAFNLKDQPYIQVYEESKKNRDYNLMLLDGALIQLKYEYNKSGVQKHVLSYLPQPNSLRYSDDPDYYEEVLYSSEKMFTEMMEDVTFCCPLRFDFDLISFKDFVHPASHLSIGNYKDCRIPIKGALSPSMFIGFILRNFYTEKFNLSNQSIFLKRNEFNETVTIKERGIMHMYWQEGLS